MFIKRLIAVISLILLCIFVKAQNIMTDAKIIAKNGDTLVGKIRNYPKNGWEHEPKTISFIAASGQEIVYIPKDIECFWVTEFGKFYQSATVELNNEPIQEDKLKVLFSPNDINKFELDKRELFLLVLAKGDLNLFEYFDENGKYHYFINANNEPIKELIYRRVIVERAEGRKIYTVDTYKKQLSEATAKCNKNKDLQFLNYNSNELLKIVTNYNQCIGKTTLITPKQENGHFWTPYLGFSSPILSVEVPQIGNKTFIDFFKPVIGIGGAWSLTRNGGGLRAGADVFFLHHAFSSKKENTPNANESIEAVYTLTGLKFNASLIYTMNGNITQTNVLKTYLRGGFGSNFLFGSDFKVNSYNSGVLSGYRPYYSRKVDYLSLLVGVGAVRNNWLAELRVERGGQLSSLLSLRTNYVTLYLGHIFKPKV